MRSARWLRAFPAILGALSLAGLTSPLWTECLSIAGTWQARLYGIAGLACTALLVRLILSWEKGETPVAKRLAWSALLVIGVGFVATLMVENCVGALDRGAQKRTLGSIRDLARILEAHAQSQGSLPVFDGTAAELAPRLMRPASSQPIPIPRVDGWGNALLVRSDGKDYTIVSLGCCGEPDAPTAVVAPNGGTTTYSADIIFTDGAFIRFPDGTQT